MEEYYGFATWSLKDNDEILVINQVDYKILDLTETKLKFKRDWLLGCTYSYKSISIAPVINTLGVSDITKTSATLYGYIETDKATVVAKIEYGTTTSYGSSAIFGRSIPGMTSMFIGIQMQDFFNPETTYHYRFTAVDGSETFYGQDATTKMFEGGVPTAGTNESGFSAINTFYRAEDGSFGGISCWWSSTGDNSSNALAFVASERISNSKKNGYSVRCIKD